LNGLIYGNWLITFVAEKDIDDALVWELVPKLAVWTSEA
jgi:hypothetical protein